MLHSLLDTSVNIIEPDIKYIVSAVLKALHKLTRCLRFRIYYYYDPCVANKKQKVKVNIRSYLRYMFISVSICYYQFLYIYFSYSQRNWIIIVIICRKLETVLMEEYQKLIIKRINPPYVICCSCKSLYI